MYEFTRQADYIYPPSVGNVTVTAATTSSVAIPIPSTWRGRYVTFEADGGDAYILFGGSGVVADPTQTSGNNQCMKLPADQSRALRIPTTAEDSAITYFIVRTASGTVNVRCAISSPRDQAAK